MIWPDNGKKIVGFYFWGEMAVPVFWFISGFLYSNQYQKRGNLCFDVYVKSVIMNLTRFLVPYTLIFVISEVLLILIKHETLSQRIIVDFLRGGIGPGSFYIICLVQFVFVFPIIYWLINNYDVRALVLLFLMNLLYELIKSKIGVTPEIHRLLLLRYLFIIACGCYKNCGKAIIFKGIKNISCCIGMLFLLLTQYMFFDPGKVQWWISTCVIAVLYVIPILDNFIDKYKDNLFERFEIIKILGKYSFNIYLFQMMFFNFDEFLYANISIWPIYVGTCICICSMGGVIFGVIEQPITKKVKGFVLKMIANE